MIKKPLLIAQIYAHTHTHTHRKCSPFYHADKIVKPLLIAQGANDPRVKKAESDQMVSAMHKAGTPGTPIYAASVSVSSMSVSSM